MSYLCYAFFDARLGIFLFAGVFGVSLSISRRQALFLGLGGAAAVVGCGLVGRLVRDVSDVPETVKLEADGYEGVLPYLRRQLGAAPMAAAGSGSDLVEVDDVLHVKLLYFDESFGDVSTIGDAWAQPECLIAQTDITLPMYSWQGGLVSLPQQGCVLGDVAPIDWCFARADATGTVIDGCSFDPTTGVATLPASVVDDYETYWAAQLQLLVPLSLTDSSSTRVRWQVLSHDGQALDAGWCETNLFDDAVRIESDFVGPDSGPFEVTLDGALDSAPFLSEMSFVGSDGTLLVPVLPSMVAGIIVRLGAQASPVADALSAVIAPKEALAVNASQMVFYAVDNSYVNYDEGMTLGKTFTYRGKFLFPYGNSWNTAPGMLSAAGLSLYGYYCVQDAFYHYTPTDWLYTGDPVSGVGSLTDIESSVYRVGIQDEQGLGYITPDGYGYNRSTGTNLVFKEWNGYPITPYFNHLMTPLGAALTSDYSYKDKAFWSTLKAFDDNGHDPTWGQSTPSLNGVVPAACAHVENPAGTSNMWGTWVDSTFTVRILAIDKTGSDPYIVLGYMSSEMVDNGEGSVQGISAIYKYKLRVKGELEIKKVVTSPDMDRDKTRKFSFSVEFSGTGAPQNDSFELAHNETKVYSDLTPGVVAIVRETSGTGDDFECTLDPADGRVVVPNGKVTVTATNSRFVGSLTIRKVLRGRSLSRKFPIRLVVRNPEGGVYIDETFDLAHNETRTFENIPRGYTYEVTETVPEPFHLGGITNATGTIGRGSNPEVVVNNVETSFASVKKQSTV